MSIPTFTQGYPLDGSSLGQTKAVIRDNLDGTFLTLGVDHINNNGEPGMQPAGYHKVIHLVSQSGDPSLISGIGQLYTKSVLSGGNTDTSLFFETGAGGGRKLQLTSNFEPLMAANGYTFMPGAAASPMPIIQWGTQAIASGPTVQGTIMFPKPFPTNVYSIQLQLVSGTPSTGSSNNSLFLRSSNIALDQFSWKYNGGSGDFISFYWIAIGN